MRKKTISLLVVLSFLMTLFPLALPAFAAGSYNVLTVPNLSDSDTFDQKPGTVRAVVPAGALDNNHVVTFRLPDGEFFDGAPGTVTPARTAGVAGTSSEYYIISNGGVDYFTVNIPETFGGDNNNLFNKNAFNFSFIDNDEFQITLNANYVSSGDDDVFEIVFNQAIKVDDGAEGDFELVASAPSTSAFPTGTLVIGRLPGGMVDLTVRNDVTDNDTFTFDLQISENGSGALEHEDDTLKLKLPDGFVWTGASTSTVGLTARWGQDIQVQVNRDDEELTVDLLFTDRNDDGTFTDPAEALATSVESSWTLPLAFHVDDDSDIEAGDVIARVSGKSDFSVSQLVVGKYGDYGANIAIDGDVPTLIAGQEEQELPKIVVTEDLRDSLVAGRTVTLTLPDGVVWQPVFDYDTTTPTPATITDLPDFSTNKSLRLDFGSYTGTDDRTARFVVQNSSSGEAKVKLEDAEVAIRADFEGELVISVAGSAGISEDLVVAEVVAPVSAAAETKPTVTIGKAGQAVADFTITEGDAGSIIDDERISLELPAGVKWDGKPDVEVVEGDLKLGNVYKTGNDRFLEIVVNNDSDEASTIKISGASVIIDRTIPEGDLKVAIGGSALVETDAYDKWSDDDRVAAVAVAFNGTPAPGDQKITAVFTLGSTNFLLNGEEQVMDVAPYAKDGRTYLPMRYVAQALGIKSSGILWKNGTATFISADRVVSVTIGSQVMNINGAPVTIDAAPEIVNGRTMLPIRWIAAAFGVDVVWNAETQEVTVN